MDGLVIGYEYYTGGLVGNASGTIRGCEFDGIVRAAKDLDNDQAGQAYIGGIVGSFSSVPSVGDEEETESFYGITDCVNRGNVEVLKGSASANAAGGIAGTNSAKITNCVNEGTVAANAGGQTEEKGTASLSVGGIVGVFNVFGIGEDGMISGCKNTHPLKPCKRGIKRQLWCQ